MLYDGNTFGNILVGIVIAIPVLIALMWIVGMMLNHTPDVQMWSGWRHTGSYILKHEWDLAYFERYRVERANFLAYLAFMHAKYPDIFRYKDNSDLIVEYEGKMFASATSRPREPLGIKEFFGDRFYFGGLPLMAKEDQRDLAEVLRRLMALFQYISDRGPLCPEDAFPYERIYEQLELACQHIPENRKIQARAFVHRDPEDREIFGMSVLPPHVTAMVKEA